MNDKIPETEPVEETGTPQPTAAEERAQVPGITRPSRWQRIRYALFNRQTRFGRFLRGLLRGVLLIGGLVGLGALAVYIFLYQPAARQAAAANEQIIQMRTQSGQTQQDLEKAQQALTNAQTQATDAQAQLQNAQAQTEIVRAMNAVSVARLALANKDNKAAASSLTDAQTALKKVQPVLEKHDPTQFSTLQAIFTLATNDLARDGKLADQDLARLLSELERADKNVSP